MVVLENLDESHEEKTEISNTEYLQLYLDAKKIEGCSERTLQYYRVTIEKLASYNSSYSLIPIIIL